LRRGVGGVWSGVYRVRTGPIWLKTARPGPLSCAGPGLGELLGLADVDWGHRAYRESQRPCANAPGLPLGQGRDALGLSHLTLRVAPTTVRTHRLDHPPFPCRSTLARSGRGSQAEFAASGTKRFSPCQLPSQIPWENIVFGSFDHNILGLHSHAPTICGRENRFSSGHPKGGVTYLR